MIFFIGFLIGFVVIAAIRTVGTLLLQLIGVIIGFIVYWLPDLLRRN